MTAHLIGRLRVLLTVGCVTTLTGTLWAGSFPIQSTGAAFPLDFEAFGTSENPGTNEFRYRLKDRRGLAAAMGAGYFPDPSSIEKDPTYQAWRRQHPELLNPWDHVRSGDAQADYYTWALTRDVGPGAKLLFTATALAEGGHVELALKGFHSVLYNFPREACASADHTFVWYVAGEALSQLQRLSAQNPDLGWQLEGAEFKVFNGQDTDLSNDRFIIHPGRWVRRSTETVVLESLSVIQRRGAGRVQLVQYANRHWQLRVDDRPFMVHGVTYNPTPVGQHIADYGLKWMREDLDKDGRADLPWQTFLDANRNGVQDSDEPAAGDVGLMQSMGVNAIRIYRNVNKARYDSREFDKPLLRQMNREAGIFVIMGDFLGAYTIGSGASWEAGTDYTNPRQRKRMKAILRAYVEDHKREPYVLMWLLGNENLMPSEYGGVNATRTNAGDHKEAYLRFVNEMAEMIHRLDPDHPVAVGNLDLIALEDHARFAPAVDIFGVNAYRGGGGFGDVWRSVRDTFDRPVLITEFGCDAWNSKTQSEDEEQQAAYHEAAWKDVAVNVGGGRGVGNAVGGVVFQFLDEWWKSPNGSWDQHESATDSTMPFPDGFASEEWYGLLTHGQAQNRLLRQSREVFFLYQKSLWK